MPSSVASVASFLSLCSRYPGGPWAGILQQTIKDKQQKGEQIKKLVNLFSAEEDLKNDVVGQ